MSKRQKAFRFGAIHARGESAAPACDPHRGVDDLSPALEEAMYGPRRFRSPDHRHRGWNRRAGFTIIPQLVIVPLFTLALVQFILSFNGRTVHEAFAQAAGLVMPGPRGIVTWILLAAYLGVFLWWLGPIVKVWKNFACRLESGRHLTDLVNRRFRKLKAWCFLLTSSLSLAICFLGFDMNALGHLQFSSWFYTVAESLAAGAFAGLMVHINLFNHLFPARYALVQLRPDLNQVYQPVYRAFMFTLPVILLFTLFVGFSTLGNFYILGADPGPAGANNAKSALSMVLTQNLPDLMQLDQAKFHEFQQTLSVLAIKIALLFFMVFQVLLQLKIQLNKPVRILEHRLSQLNNDSGAPAQAVQIVDNNEFTRVFREINILIQRQQERLESSRKQLDDILHTAADPILIWDQDRIIRAFNPAAQAYFATPEDQAMGRKLDEVLGQGMVTGAVDGCPDTGVGESSPVGLEGGLTGASVPGPAGKDGGAGEGDGGKEKSRGPAIFPVDSEGLVRVENFRMGNRCLNFEAHISLSPGPEGTWNTAILRDISRTMEAQRVLDDARKTAEHANRMKSEFLANMSHELRTPLNAVLGFTQLMSNDLNLTPTQKDRIRIISNSGEHLLALINDILDISKIEAGKVELHPVVFDLPGFLQDLQDMFGLKARQKGITFYTDVLGQIPRYVTGDLGKLRQVMINLIGNAVKFTSSGGVGLIAGMDGDLVRFTVNDTGRGIPENELESIMNPFVQSSLTDNEGGTGLGLTISRSFVTMMDSRLEISSKVGEGSSFTFAVRLPESGDAPAAMEKRGRVLALAGSSSPRILVVDDQHTNRLVLKEMLESLGFVTMEAKDGKESLERMGEFHPDVVFMDLKMPVMDGYEACRAIKDHPSHSHVPVFALTASAFKHDEARITAAGFDGWLAKPFKQETLFDLLEDKSPIRFVREAEADAPVDAPAGDPEELARLLDPDDARMLQDALDINDFARIRELGLALASDARKAPAARLVRSLAEAFDEDGLGRFLKSIQGNK